MKFTVRLVLISIIVVVTFVAVTVLSLQIVRTYDSYANGIATLDLLTQRIWRLQSLSYQVYNSAYIDESYEAWEEASTALFDDVDAFAASSFTESVSSRHPEFAREVGRLVAVAAIIGEEIEEYRARFAVAMAGFDETPAWSLVHLRYTQSIWDLALFQQQVDSLASALDESLSGVVERLSAELEEIRDGATTTLDLVFIGIQVVALAALVLVILFFRFSLRRRFTHIRAGMEQLSSGDFTVKLAGDGRDELSEVLRHVQAFVDAFSGVIAGIKGIADEVSASRSEMMGAAEESEASVTQISGSITSITGTVEELDQIIDTTKTKLATVHGAITELQNGVEVQSQAVAESASAVEQMTASINNVSAITDERRDAADRLRGASDEGQTNIEATDANVAAIQGAVEEVLGIITVINKIASQTNILAMNAAIEAAHAGEFGRGFAVVAEEIRNLSTSTNENAKRIREQLDRVADLVRQTHEKSVRTKSSFGSIRSEVLSTAQAFDEINATMRELAEGTQSVMQAANRAGEITGQIHGDVRGVASQSSTINDSIDHVRDISQSVRSGMNEINVGAGEINTTLVHMAKVTQQTYDRVGQLYESVARFRIHDERVDEEYPE